MSFQFNWPKFDELGLSDRMMSRLESALNKGPKPPHICDHIEVKQLRMGSLPPELDILEIAELTSEKFKGTFRLAYAGDASLLLQTKVQVNPVTQAEHLLGEYDTSSTMIGQSSLSLLSPYTHHTTGVAHKPLIVPMQLQISALKLNALITLTVDKHRGVTICFKNDPLESVRVSSTFDELASVRKMLQQEIETKLQMMFSDDIPEIVHKFSLDFLGVEEPQFEESLKQRQSGNSTDSGFPTSISAFPSHDSGLGPSAPNSNLQLDSSTHSLDLLPDENHEIKSTVQEKRPDNSGKLTALEKLALTEQNLKKLEGRGFQTRRKSSTTKSAMDIPRFVGLGELSLRNISNPLAASDMGLNDSRGSKSRPSIHGSRLLGTRSQTTSPAKSMDAIHHARLASQDFADRNRSIIMHRWSNYPQANE